MSDKPYTSPVNGSFPSSTGQLILVATPIGNLTDISQRALEALKTAKAILCEDTRVTTKLLRHYGINNQLIPLHDHNEQERIPTVIEQLQQGQCLALVSDAGTPIVSDPGYRLVRAAQEAEIAITSLPGANAAITALTLSGLPPHPFMFLGFPPRGEARRQHFAALRAMEQAGLTATLLWYESPHRLLDTLHTQQQVFGADRAAAIGRELTKHFEEMRRGTIAELIAHFEANPPRGEITLLLGPPEAAETGALELDHALEDALKTHSVKDAASLVAGIVTLPKRTVYQRALELAKRKKSS